MLTAKYIAILLFVSVAGDSRVTLIDSVKNVSSCCCTVMVFFTHICFFQLDAKVTLSAGMIKPASTVSARILACSRNVEQMPSVRPRITRQTASVLPTTMEIHTSTVNHMSVWLTQTVQTLSLAERETVLIPASVPSMPTAQEETTGAFAIASLDTQEILMATNAHLVRTFQKGCLGFFLKKACCLFSVPPPDLGCRGDVECPSQLACIDRDCQNPCLVARPCVQNADCKVYDTLPRRTMSCTCREGYKGRGDERCEKIGNQTTKRKKYF